MRNSWGEFWGEMGYVRVAKGNNALHLEEQCSWAVPKAFTETNFPCYEDGSNVRRRRALLPVPRAPQCSPARVPRACPSESARLLSSANCLGYMLTNTISRVCVCSARRKRSMTSASCVR